jgi:hypothetical protein
VADYQEVVQTDPTVSPSLFPFSLLRSLYSRAIAYLHNSTPQIIHRNLTWRNIFVNPGVGDLYVGGMWLAAIIVNGPEVPISVSDALSSQYIGSPPCIPSPSSFHHFSSLLQIELPK